MHVSWPSVTQANSREKHRRRKTSSSDLEIFWLAVLASVELGPSQAEHDGGRSVW